MAGPVVDAAATGRTGKPAVDGPTSECLASLRLDLLGLRVEILARDPRLLVGVASCFEGTSGLRAALMRPGADLLVMLETTDTETGENVDAFRVSVEPPRALAVAGPDCVCTSTTLAGQLTTWAAATTLSHYVFHAGSVARSGQGILLPGPSESGKTTLVAGLVRRGFDLLSDEVGAFELTSSKMAAYPRALFVRGDVLHVLGLDESSGSPSDDPAVRIVSAADLGGKRGEGGADLRLVVAPHFLPDAPTRLERLSWAEATEVLIGSFGSLRRLKLSGLDRLIDLAGRADCYRLTFSDLESALDAIASAWSGRATSACEAQRESRDES